METSALPPGCVRCPSCGFVGGPVVRGRASTGGAVAASLLCAPILGPLMIASQPGELACPRCGQSFGRAPVFSNYQRADAPPTTTESPGASASMGFKVFLLVVLALVMGACLLAALSPKQPPPYEPAGFVPAPTPAPEAPASPRHHRRRSSDRTP